MRAWFSNKIAAISQWEYLNTWLIYLPLFPLGLYFSFKNRKIFFFEKTNPGIKFGGMAMQSKIDIYNLLPPESIPKTLFISKDEAKNFDLSQIKNYPIVTKPNEGLKGLGVTFINSASELSNYLQNTQLDIILQEKITGNIELGVFYCRYPNQENGFITSITKKKHMVILGDGKSTVRQLAKQNSRISRQLKSLEKICFNTLESIPEKGKTVEILPIGSHTRGSHFKDVTEIFKEAIHPIINIIAKKIEGFYYGRFDIICRVDESTHKVIDFKIIELNGTMSEPIHIYDPKNSLFYAWRQIIRHWKIMSKIAYSNKNQTTKSIGFFNGLKLIAQNVKLERKLKNELFG